MKPCWALLCGISLISSSIASAQGPLKSVVRLDPRLDQILSVDAVPELVVPGTTFIEGPTWIAGRPGYLIYSDVARSVINKLGADGKVAVIVDNVSGDPGRAMTVDTGPNGKQLLPGPDGTAVDREGRITYTEFSNGRVVRVEKDGTRAVMAERFDGLRFNSPNDLTYKSDGSLYFTDSGADTTRAADDPRRGIPTRGVYRVKDGKVEQLTKDVSPNGIAFSPDEKYLYVTQAGRKIVRFDVQPDGTIINGKIFFDLDIDPKPGAPDGLHTDKDGNVYSTGPGGVWIISPDGTHLGTLLAPGPRFSNFIFGGDDGRLMFLTATEGLYRVRLQTSRVAPAR